jgi:hypothetical protein
MTPASQPVMTPMTVETEMIGSIMGLASGLNQADKPSSNPNTPPAMMPITGLLTMHL